MEDQDFLDLSGVRPPSKLDGDTFNDSTFPILQGISPIHVKILKNSARLMHVSKGVEMLHEGDSPHDLYFVESGKLAVAKKVGGQTKVIAQLLPGSVYGEIGALRKKVRYASVYTTEPSRIYRIDMPAVQQVLEVDAVFKERLSKMLHERMLDSFFFSHPVLQKLTAEERKALGQHLKTVYFETNTTIFAQGNKPNGVYLIISGEVEVRHRASATGPDILIEIRRGNDVLGEVSVKNGTALAYSAIAASDTDLLHLDEKVMKMLAANFKVVHSALETFFKHRAERTVERLKENR